MRYGYWWIEALLGVVLIAAPYLGHFTGLRAALYTDVLVGAVLVIWALVGYLTLGEQGSHGAQPTRA
jgi:hypothetical protein